MTRNEWRREIERDLDFIREETCTILKETPATDVKNLQQQMRIFDDTIAMTYQLRGQAMLMTETAGVL